MPESPEIALSEEDSSASTQARALEKMPARHRKDEKFGLVLC